jgi:3-methyladenine DNA glycosylase Tag
MTPQSHKALNTLVTLCKTHSSPDWEKEIAPRLSKKAHVFPDDRGFMRIFSIAIAYSQNAQSKQVSRLVESVKFHTAFSEFDPLVLSKASAKNILLRFWPHLGAMRFKGKVQRIIDCAKVLVGIQKESGSFENYLKVFQIPRRLRSPNDVEQFWIRFDLLRADLRQRQIPFFGSTISLLQLLVDLDFDSVKPDLIVMRFARRIGLVEKETGERFFRTAARAIQAYALDRGLRARAVDLMVLAFGGQTGARDLLSERFCPPADPCRNAACSIGAKHLCKAYTA